MLILLTHSIGSKDPKGPAYNDCPDDAITSDTWSTMEKLLVSVTPRISQSGDSGHTWQFWHVLRTSALWFPEYNFVRLLAVEVEVVIRSPGLYMLDLDFTAGNVPGWYD